MKKKQLKKIRRQKLLKKLNNEKNNLKTKEEKRFSAVKRVSSHLHRKYALDFAFDVAPIAYNELYKDVA